MAKYLSEECVNCDEHVNPYGCMWHSCPIYKGIEEYHADIECDRIRERKFDDNEDGKIHPIFEGILDNIKGVRNE